MIPSTERILYELHFRERSLMLGECLLTRLQMRGKLTKPATEKQCRQTYKHCSQTAPLIAGRSSTGIYTIKALNSQALLFEFEECQTVLSGF